MSPPAAQMPPSTSTVPPVPIEVPIGDQPLFSRFGWPSFVSIVSVTPSIPMRPQARAPSILGGGLMLIDHPGGRVGDEPE